MKQLYVVGKHRYVIIPMRTRNPNNEEPNVDLLSKKSYFIKVYDVLIVCMSQIYCKEDVKLDLYSNIFPYVYEKRMKYRMIDRD